MCVKWKEYKTNPAAESKPQGMLACGLSSAASWVHLALVSTQRCPNQPQTLPPVSPLPTARPLRWMYGPSLFLLDSHTRWLTAGT